MNNDFMGDKKSGLRTRNQLLIDINFIIGQLDIYYLPIESGRKHAVLEHYTALYCPELFLESTTSSILK